jgi:ADP-heptose:LPS heptosyltransferase
MMLGVDVAGYICLFPYVIFRRLKGKLLRPEKVQRIAILRIDGIGDLVLSGPALKAFKSDFPNARITLFVNDWTDGLASLLDGLDEIVELKAPLFKAFKGTLSWRDWLAEKRILKEYGRLGMFDLAVDLRGDFLSIFTAWWLGAERLASRSSRGGGFLLTNVIHQPDEGKISEVDLNTWFVRRLSGKTATAEKARLKPPPEEKVRSMIKKMPPDGGDDYICLSVSAPYESRRYPADKWIEVIKLIRKEYDRPILILGGQADFERCEHVATRAGDKVFNMAGKFSLLETAACISGARLMIGIDGGLIHIASALDRPVIQLFGRENPVCFGHYDINEHVIHKSCQFNPCAESMKCMLPQSFCMDRISPDEIYENARPYLS